MTDIRNRHWSNILTLPNTRYVLRKKKFIAKEESLTKRKVSEKIEINIALDYLNRDYGTKLSDTWKPLLHDLRINGNNQTN